MSATTGDLLGTIVAATRRIVETRREACPEASIERQALRRTPAGDAFADALRQPDRFNVIAECKRRSPSKGILRRDYDAPAVAAAYARQGAAAISVLTEPTFFDGALEHLTAVRAAVPLPLLRKDFIIERYQLLEARAAGADAILLIVAALDQATLVALQREAWSLGLAVLVEAHDADEVRRAVDAGASIVGVNNRNLRTLEVSVQACETLIGEIPGDCTAVAESGLRTHDDLARLSALGYRAFLVGERLVTAEDPGAALHVLMGGDTPVTGGTS